MTVGQEFKDATLANLVHLAREVLNLHDTLRTRAITNCADIEAYQEDLRAVEQQVHEMKIHAVRCWRYYDQGGTE